MTIKKIIFIKYKKWENLEGPVYNIDKKEVFMIKYSNGSKDVFVHQSNIHAKGFRMLQEDERVEFEVEYDNISGKKKAINVTGLGGAYVQGG